MDVSKMKNNFPADLFDAGASLLMLRHLTHEADYQALAVQMVGAYKDAISDQTVERDLPTAVDAALNWLEDQECDFDLLVFLKAFHQYCLDFRPDGKPVRKLFNGLWFTRDKPDPDRKARFVKRLMDFYGPYSGRHKTRYITKAGKLDLVKG